ncbi:MAG: hypothetical protein WCK64_00435 [Synechococcaceae cyanobacterium ELA445]|jgi:hypothetical protein
MAPDPTAPPNTIDSREGSPGSSRGGTAIPTSSPATGQARPDGSVASTSELLEQLSADRLWLLQQIDGGAWPDLRLDLAALERELGQILEQAAERLKP